MQVSCFRHCQSLFKKCRQISQTYQTLSQALFKNTNRFLLNVTYLKTIQICYRKIIFLPTLYNNFIIDKITIGPHY